MPALYQDDDDGNDLSDLGLSKGKKSNEDDGGDDSHHMAGEKLCEDEAAADQEEDVFRGAEEPAVAVSTAKVTTVTTTVTTTKTTITGDSVAENGYDRAIKDYVDFAESKKTSVAKCDELQQSSHQQQQQQPPCRKPLAEVKRRMSAPKIEEKVMLLKTRSQSTRDLNAATTSELPKVDIGKRREIFEKICLETKAEVQQTTAINRLPPPPLVPKKKSVESVASPPSTIAASCTTTVTDIRQQVIDEVSPPVSPPPGKIFERISNNSRSNLYFIYIIY